MALRRGVSSVLATVLFGGTLAVTLSVPPVTAENTVTPIILPMPGEAEYSILIGAGGDRVAGVFMPGSSLIPLVWDFSGSSPEVTELGLPDGAFGAIPSAVDDDYAAGGTFDGQMVVWDLSDTTNPIPPDPLGVPDGWASVSPTALDGNWLVGTGEDESGQPRAVAWELPSTTPTDLGTIPGATDVEVNAVSGTWAVGSFTVGGLKKPVAWDLSVGSPTPIVLPPLVTDEGGQGSDEYGTGSAVAIATGQDGIAVAVGNIDMSSVMSSSYQRAVAWKLADQPSAPAALRFLTSQYGSGVATMARKASAGWVLGDSVDNVVAWDLSAWTGTAEVISGKILGSLDNAAYSGVAAVAGNWAVGSITVEGLQTPVAWDLSQSSPAAIALPLPDGDTAGSAFAVAGGYIVGSSGTYPGRAIAWKLSELDGGGGGTTSTVTVEKPTGGTIAGSGINCGPSGNTCSISVEPGTEVTLTATVATGYVFTGWGAGACSAQQKTSTCTFTGNTPNVSVTAEFSKGWTLIVDEVTNARISSSTQGVVQQINCGNGSTSCSTSVIDGTLVQLVISPNESYALDEWTGCDSVTNGVCTITMDADTTIGATLTTLGKIAIVPSGAGAITSTDDKLNCSSGFQGTCFVDYPEGDEVTLEAPLQASLKFLGWTGTTCNEGRTSLTCTFTVVGGTRTTIRANWERLQKVAVVSNPNGTVTSADGRIVCGVDQVNCEAFYQFPPTVTFTAIPKPGYLFTGWERPDGCSRARMSPTCTVNRWSGSYTAQATFAEAVRLDVTRRNLGTIASSDGKIKCGTVDTLCSALVPKGSNVLLTATPDSGNELGFWMYRLGQSGGCQYTNKCYLVVDDDLTFEGMAFRTPVTLTLVAPSNGKVVQSWVQSGFENTAVDCGLGASKCSATYMVSPTSGQRVNLEARGAPGWYFAGWEGCSSSSDDCLAVVNRNMTITAKFVKASKITVPQDTGGIISSADRRIKCGPGFANCSFTYQGAPQVDLQFEAVSGFRQIVVGWKGCFMNGYAGWAADTWTRTSSGCSLIPGADSRPLPVLSTLSDATRQILSRAYVSSYTRLAVQEIANQIQAGTNCTADLATFLRELTLLHNRGSISVADGLILVAGAKSLCRTAGVARESR